MPPCPTIYCTEHNVKLICPAAMGAAGGKIGGRARTRAKKKSSARNGKLGGRPKKVVSGQGPVASEPSLLESVWPPGRKQRKQPSAIGHQPSAKEPKKVVSGQ